MPRLALLLFSLFATGAAAQPQFPEAPPPPPERPATPGEQAPPDVEALEREEELQPEVTIIQERHARIEEYRVGGRLVYVRIVPAKGAPYYLFDSDGDGSLDRRAGNLENPPLNQWILRQW